MLWRALDGHRSRSGIRQLCLNHPIAAAGGLTGVSASIVVDGVAVVAGFKGLNYAITAASLGLADFG